MKWQTSYLARPHIEIGQQQRLDKISSKSKNLTFKLTQKIRNSDDLSKPNFKFPLPNTTKNSSANLAGNLMFLRPKNESEMGAAPTLQVQGE